MSEELKYAKLHVAPFYPGLGQMTVTLDTIANPGMRLTYLEYAIELNFKGIRVLIPHANVVCAVCVEGRPVSKPKAA